MADVRPHARRHRALRVAAVLVAIPLVLAIVLVALLDSDAVVNRVKNSVLPIASDTLGREVTVDRVSLGLLPPAVRLEGLKVAGATSKAPALVEAQRANAGLAVWPLLRSLGKDVQVKDMTLDGVAINLERRANGTWAHDDVLDRLAAQPSSNRTYAIDRLELNDGAVNVTDRMAAGGTAKAALTDLDVTVRDYGVGRPTHLEWRAALQSKEQNLSGDIELDALPASFKDLAPEKWPDVKGRFALADLPISTVRAFLPPSLATTVEGGRLRLESRLHTDADHRYGFDGELDLVNLALRGTPANGRLVLAGSMEPGNPDSLVVDVKDAGVHGDAIQLSGTAKLRAKPLAVNFELGGPLLDLGVLGATSKAPPPEQESDLPLLAPSTRRQLQSARVDGTVKIDRVVRGKLEASNFRANAHLVGGELRLSEARADFFGGTLDASGTQVDLAKEQPDWKLAARLDTVDVGAASQQLAGSGTLGGHANGTLTLVGTGVDWAHVREVLDGGGRVRVEDAKLPTAELGLSFVNALRGGIQQLAGGALPGMPQMPQDATTTRDLDAWFRVNDGWVELQQPIGLTIAGNRFQLGGRVGLDRRLDLTGTVQVDPSLVSSISGNRLKPAKPFDLPIKVGGTLDAPQVAGLDTRALATALVGREVDEASKRIENEARDRLKGLLNGL